MSKPLTGVKILDLTWALAGPYGTMMLADLGAEVIKVEIPRGGDRSRFQGPKINGVSTYYYSINRGKKSIVLDLKSREGKDIALKLVKQVDVVVENFTPGTMDKLGLGYEDLRKVNPKIIYAALSGFGKDGPYRDLPCLDSIVQAMGGMMSVTGFPDGPPIRSGASIGDITGGMFLAVGILAALAQRALNNGEGQMVDLSLLDCQAALMENAFVRYFATGEIPERVGNRHPVSAIHQVFPTQDGHMAVVASGGVEMWARFLEIIGRLDLLPIEKYQNKLLRAKHVKELEPIISAEMVKKPTVEWMKDFQEAGIPCGPVNTIPQAAADPQLNHRQMFVDLPCPQIPAGHMKVSNSPLKFSATPVKIEAGAPDFGENTAEILSSMLKMSKEEIDALEAKGVTKAVRIEI